MEDKIQDLLQNIKRLEDQLLIEIQRKEEEFYYQIKRKRVKFEREIKVRHKLLVKKIRTFIREASLLNILTAPVIYSIIFPAMFMDLFITIFQNICFPAYGIPKVKREDYIVLDRQYIGYLNGIEKFNCLYCGYFNGLIGYVREIAGRTEQYWCPIKHARRIKSFHSRYSKFFDYGDGESYRRDIENLRRDFDDIK